MDDYISRKTFIEQKRKLYCENCSRRKDSKGKTVYEIGDAPCRSCGIGDVLDDLDDFPAADVRPVVLCRDCVHFTAHSGTGSGYCGFLDIGMSQESFCSNGEKEE